MDKGCGKAFPSMEPGIAKMVWKKCDCDHRCLECQRKETARLAKVGRDRMHRGGEDRGGPSQRSDER